MKLCLNCGEKLLDGAKKCPSCSAKAKDFPIVDSDDKEKISLIISSVPNPKSGTPNWVANVEAKQRIWTNSKSGQKQQVESRVENAKAQGLACCPKCGYTSITFVNKRLSIGRALIGNAIAGGKGAVLGGLSSKAGNNKCLNCGFSWKI